MPPIDHESPIYAAVELGSDSFRLHIGRFNDGVLELVATMCEKIELSASLDEDGMLGSAALRGALACLASTWASSIHWAQLTVRHGSCSISAACRRNW
jgi:hypothetical protein